jgi:Zn finger protein HypA/HybF involved in hydrogenase expression
MPRSTQQHFGLAEIEGAIFDGLTGFCVNCRHEQYNVEPDARNYVCEECGQPEVFGAEELLVMGLVDDE